MNDKTKQANECNTRLKFEDGGKDSMVQRERDLLKMRDNYDQTMNALSEKRSNLEKLLKEERD